MNRHSVDLLRAVHLMLVRIVTAVREMHVRMALHSSL